MLGGDFYCFHCGRMQSLDDYESPIVVDYKEKLVYCREGECKAKCRQRAPGQLLKLMNENKKKL